jgi:hypothetical protein
VPRPCSFAKAPSKKSLLPSVPGVAAEEPLPATAEEADRAGHFIAFQKERALQRLVPFLYSQMVQAAQTAGVWTGVCMLSFSRLFNKMALTVWVALSGRGLRASGLRRPPLLHAWARAARACSGMGWAGHGAR